MIGACSASRNMPSSKQKGIQIFHFQDRPKTTKSRLKLCLRLKIWEHLQGVYFTYSAGAVEYTPNECPGH